MKLGDMPDNQGRGVAVSVDEAIKLMGYASEAAYRVFDDAGNHRYWVVTGAGLCVGDYTLPAQNEVRNRGELNVELIPWTKVAGARMATAGFLSSGEGPTLHAWIADPEFEATVGPHGDQKALADFINPVMQRQLSWAVPHQADEERD